MKRARRGEGPDRPGWPAPDSSVPDLGELIRHTGLAGCAVVGLSGGGPTALACGLLLAGQVTAVATVAGAAPLVPRDPRQPPDRLMIKTARRSQAAACALFAAILRAGRIRPEQVLRRFAALLARPDADLLRDEAGLRDGFLGDLRHPSPTAALAAARDFWLFAPRWDIDLAGMAVPAHIWQGTQDRNVPVADVIAARCPAARRHIVDGGGHMLLSHLEHIMDSITPRRR